MLNILITILLVVFSLIFKKSKFIAIVFFLFMWTLWGWNTWNGDYDAYENIFLLSNLETSSVEFGYSLYNKFLNSIGISFQHFMILSSLIVLSIVAIFTLKFTKYPALYSSIYFVIFIMEYVFIRNYISHALLLTGFMLVVKEVRFAKFFFFCFIILAASIHYSSLFFVIFILAIYPSRIIKPKIALPILLLSFFASLFMFNYVLSGLGANYVDKFSYYAHGSGFTTISLAHLLIVMLVIYFFYLVQKDLDLSFQVKKTIITVVNINIVSLLYLLVYYHVPYFGRFIRFLFMFDLGMLLFAFHYVSSFKTRKKMLLIFLSVFIALLILFSGSTLDLTLVPLYKENLIW